MSRRLLAATALALLMPLVETSAQTRVTGVLQGSLVLLPASGAAANVKATHVASIAVASAVRATGQMEWFADYVAPEPIPDITASSIRAVVSSAGDRLIVWAANAERIELRYRDAGAPTRIVECRRASTDPATPATCDAAPYLPDRATLTVYLRLDGSR